MTKIYSCLVENYIIFRYWKLATSCKTNQQYNIEKVLKKSADSLQIRCISLCSLLLLILFWSRNVRNFFFFLISSKNGLSWQNWASCHHLYHLRTVLEQFAGTKLPNIESHLKKLNYFDATAVISQHCVWTGFSKFWYSQVEIIFFAKENAFLTYNFVFIVFFQFYRTWEQQLVHATTKYKRWSPSNLRNEIVKIIELFLCSWNSISNQKMLFLNQKNINQVVN